MVAMRRSAADNEVLGHREGDSSAHVQDDLDAYDFVWELLVEKQGVL